MYINYQAPPGVVLMFADVPTRLYIVTSVKASPKNPSWIAQERKRMLPAADIEQNLDLSMERIGAVSVENRVWKTRLVIQTHFYITGAFGKMELQQVLLIR